MIEELKTVDKGGKLRTIVFAVLVIVAVMSLTSISLLAGWIDLSGFENNNNLEPGYTTFFTTINVEEVQGLINNSVNITIVDVRSCKCSYNKERIPNAVWSRSCEEFYNTTNDILVYCTDGGKVSSMFCEGLVNHTYGDIYHLEGGINNWKFFGCETEP